MVKKKNTAYLCVEVKENKRIKKIQLARVHGWKAKLAYEFFNFEANEWNDEVARAFIGLNALRVAKDEWEARKFIKVVKEMRKLDLHFWVDKFFREKKKADRAWRIFYEG